MNKNFKRLLLIIGMIGMLIVSGGCYYNKEDNTTVLNKDELWNISEMGNIHTIVKEDPDTGVQYIIIMDSYKNSIAITRRDNADGTPYISKSSNP